jgi:hypothetical protein
MTSISKIEDELKKYAPSSGLKKTSISSDQFIIEYNKELILKVEKLTKKCATLTSKARETNEILKVYKAELSNNKEYYRSLISILSMAIIVLGLNKISCFFS